MTDGNRGVARKSLNGDGQKIRNLHMPTCFGNFSESVDCSGKSPGCCDTRKHWSKFNLLIHVNTHSTYPLLLYLRKTTKSCPTRRRLLLITAHRSWFLQGRAECYVIDRRLEREKNALSYLYRWACRIKLTRVYSFGKETSRLVVHEVSFQYFRSPVAIQSNLPFDSFLSIFSPRALWLQ